MFEIVFINERMPDFFEMLLHHIVHSCLMFSCLFANIVNGGTVIIFVHVFSDIFLQASKSINYLGLMQGPALGVFVLSNLTWFWGRVVCYPFLILHGQESRRMSMRPEFEVL